MMRVVTRAAAGVAVLAALSGCKEEPLEGYLWDVHMLAVIDDCNTPTVGYEEDFTYRLSFEEENVVLSIDADAFATGRIAGCEIIYESVVWGEQRNGYEVRWQLTGEAIYRQGGDTCNLPSGTDWIGTETYTIISSEDPNLSVGCEYILEVDGVYAGASEGNAE